MSKKNKGLFKKYNVTKADGTEVKGDCVVLKFDDPLAKGALIRWAADMGKAGHLQLESDVLNKLKWDTNES